MAQEKETDIRARVRDLKKFYVDLTLFGAVNVGLILIWAISGGGYFWPIWVFVGWGIGLVLRAISMGMIPALADLVPFFDEQWEEQQVKKLMGQKSSPATAPQSAAAPKAKTAPKKKAVAKKVAPKATKPSGTTPPIM